jgi:hypothetical protein
MPDQLLYVLRSSYHGACLSSLADFDDIASPSARLDYAYPTMVSAVWHAFVYAGVDSYLDFVSWIIGPEEAAKTYFASLSRFLSEKSSRS